MNAPLPPITATGAIALACLLACTGARAETEADLDALARRIGEQSQRLEALRQALEREEAGLAEMRRALADRTRNGAQAATTAAPTAPPAAGSDGTVMARQAPVGAAPEPARPAAAPLFEEPGVLTAKGRVVLEPSLQYSYASSNRVTLLGYTVVPAVLVGLIDVREVKRNTTTAALTARWGATRRLELEARVPYVWRSDATRSREVAAGTPSDSVFGASGRDLGDVEVAARWQLNDGGADRPTLVGSLRVKSRTGIDPFEVVSDCVRSCSDSSSGTGQPLTLPTGSGFYSIQPGLTWLIPSDPAVLFGSVSYLHSVARDVTRNVLGGQKEALGRIAPGGVFGFNVGMGLALNETASFSIGYDHASVAPTRQNGAVVPGSMTTQLGTLLLGYSLRTDADSAWNFTLGAGLTPDTPDLTLSLRRPLTF